MDFYRTHISVYRVLSSSYIHTYIAPTVHRTYISEYQMVKAEIANKPLILNIYQASQYPNYYNCKTRICYVQQCMLNIFLLTCIIQTYVPTLQKTLIPHILPQSLSPKLDFHLLSFRLFLFVKLMDFFFFFAPLCSRILGLRSPSYIWFPMVHVAGAWGSRSPGNIYIFFFFFIALKRLWKFSLYPDTIIFLNACDFSI